MTCLDRYLMEHALPVKGCPHHYGYLEKPKNCYCISCFKDCWAREIPENVSRTIDKLNSVGNVYPIFPDETKTIRSNMKEKNK